MTRLAFPKPAADLLARLKEETPLAGRRASDAITGGVYQSVALDAADVNRW